MTMINSLDEMIVDTRYNNLQKAQHETERAFAMARNSLQNGLVKGEYADLKLLEQVHVSDLGEKLVAVPDSILGCHSKFNSSSNSGLQNSDSSSFRCNQDIHVLNNQSHSHISLSHLQKMEFPKFDGSNPRSWMIRCDEYFKQISNVPDYEKFDLASKYFEGKAATWFESLLNRQLKITWNRFLELISIRFEDFRDTKMFKELGKLKHVGLYSDYVREFEELLWEMPMPENDMDLYEDYYTSRFIMGLSEKLQVAISMLNPRSLYHAMELGEKLVNGELMLIGKESAHVDLQNVLVNEGISTGQMRDCDIVADCNAIREAEVVIIDSSTLSDNEFVSIEEELVLADNDDDLSSNDDAETKLEQEMTDLNMLYQNSASSQLEPVYFDYEDIASTISSDDRRVRIKTIATTSDFAMILGTALYVPVQRPLNSFISTDFIEELPKLEVEPVDEKWWNTNFHFRLRITHFQSLYGYTPPYFYMGLFLGSYSSESFCLVQERIRLLLLLKANLIYAQQMQMYTDRNGQDRIYEVWENAYLLKPLQQSHVFLNHYLKRAPCSHWPFTILKIFRAVSYCLDLHMDSCIKPVLHVPLLEIAPSPDILPLPDLLVVTSRDEFLVLPEHILEDREVLRNGWNVSHVLVQGKTRTLVKPLG